MKRTRRLASLNGIVFLMAFLVSVLSQFKLVGTKDVGQVSGQYDSVFAPAGITFSVWGVIYLSLFAFCIYHIVSAYKKDVQTEASWETDQISWLFIINNLATGGWIFAWLYEYLIISVILMLIQLITLISINIRLDIFDPNRSLSSRIFTQFPLSIYFAWICIASIANISAALIGYRWGGWGVSPSHWAIILITAASLISIFVIIARQNIFFGLVVIWALYGIVLKRNSIDPDNFKNVVTAAWTGIALVILSEIVQLIKIIRISKVTLA